MTNQYQMVLLHFSTTLQLKIHDR